MERPTTDQTDPNVVPVGSTAVAPLPATQNESPLDLIARLLQSNVTPEQLDKFLDVQQKWEREQQRRDYVQAMTQFKAALVGVKIVKRKRVKYNEVDYKHETLAQVVKAVVGPMSANGLTHHWSVEQPKAAGEPIVVSCVLTHNNGHSERVTLHGLPDDSGKKNKLQQVRSTVTYLQRATLLLITGLAAEGDDDDGLGGDPDGPAGALSVEQVDTVNRLIEESASDKDAFLKWIDAPTVNAIPAKKFDTACRELNAAKRRRLKKVPPQ